MISNRKARSLPLALGLGIALGPILVLPGCNDDTAPVSGAPEDAPAAKGKGSMDYYRDQMKKGGTKKK